MTKLASPAAEPGARTNGSNVDEGSGSCQFPDPIQLSRIPTIIDNCVGSGLPTRESDSGNSQLPEPSIPFDPFEPRSTIVHRTIIASLPHCRSRKLKLISQTWLQRNAEFGFSRPQKLQKSCGGL
jgi:hypothetical protein